MNDLNSSLTRIQQLRELLKSYYIFESVDANKGRDILARINEIRLALAVEAEMRQVYWAQIRMRQNATGFQENYFFTRGDTEFTINGAIANLTSTVLISLLHQGARQNVLTREATRWQMLFSAAQIAAPTGQQIPFDFEQDLYFKSNQSLQIGVTGETSATGFIFPRGCNVKDDNPFDLKALTEEIENSLPQWQIIPLTFLFPAGQNEAIDVAGNQDIYSIKSDRSVLLTHVSASSVSLKLSIFDDGRSQQLCDRVEGRGVAGMFSNSFASYYPLPYPHLLRKQDRMKMRALNGSDISGTTTEDQLQYLTFSGFAI